MAYSVHNFEQGDILYASQLNEMDAQIALNEQNISSGISSDMLAEDYSANKTYSIGDYVMYNDELYRCIYEITAAEGWNPAHWQEANLGDGISDLNNAISVLTPSATTTDIRKALLVKTVTGGKVTEYEYGVCDEIVNYNDSRLWVNNAIDVNTGAVVANNRRIKTKKRLKATEFIKATPSSEYGIGVFKYVNNVFAGVLTSNNTFVIGGPLSWVYGTFTSENLPNVEYELVVRGRNNQVIYTTDGANCTITAYASEIEDMFPATTDEPIMFRIGTWNIGHFNDGASYTPAGAEENKLNYRKAIAEMGCQIISLNEADEYYNESLSEQAYPTIFANYKEYLIGVKSSYQCNGFLTNYNWQDRKRTQFEEHKQETYFYEADFNVQGHLIHIVSTQLDWYDNTMRRAQIAQLITALSGYDTVIICGDMNPGNRVNGEVPAGESILDVYAEDYAIWTAAGYKLANAGYLGEINTMAVHEQDPDPYPWDNIIVKGAVHIMDVGRVKMDFITDHYPFWADLTITFTPEIAK